MLRVKNQGRTKDEPRMNQRNPKLKKVLLLRLPSFFLLLYLPLFHREGVRRNALRVLRPRSLHFED